MRNSLRNFDKLCSLLSQQVEVTVNGKPAQVKDSGDGNIQVNADIAAQQADVETVPDQNLLANAIKIQQLVQDLQTKLQDSIQTARAARQYQNFASNASQVIYDKGYAQGKKQIIRYVIKQLNTILEDE